VEWLDDYNMEIMYSSETSLSTARVHDVTPQRTVSFAVATARTPYHAEDIRVNLLRLSRVLDTQTYIKLTFVAQLMGPIHVVSYSKIM
jgi:hypothetical protein